MTNQFWRHARSGEVYAVRVEDDHVVRASGPLYHSEVRVDLLDDIVTNAIGHDLADDIDATQDDYLLHVPAPELVDVTEIAERLGTTPGTVHSWRRRHADFPAPIAALAIGPIWAWSEIERWAARPRVRTGRPRKS